ncbi:phage major capsid protein [Nonomuraea sp. NPDC059023]|uniref:phage major capsid protein n=1 Tax=unclassified Nonomuraea TaxID=2593643 RepID=UPI0036AC9DEF
MLEFLRSQLQTLLNQRAELASSMNAVLEAPKTEARALTAEETTQFEERAAALEAHDGKITEARGRLEAAEAAERRQDANNQLAAKLGQTSPESPKRSGVKVTSEPLTYARGNGHSYFLDLANATLRNNTDAAARLARHATELDVELPAREHAREQRAHQQLAELDRSERIRHAESVFEKRVNPNRVDGQGGYFVPPLWLVDEYIDLPRFGRAFANTVRTMDLPTGTDSVNVPKIATGTRTGVQTADAAAVISQDLTDTFVNAPVRTIAGQQDVAMQLLDQSPVAFDEVVFADLIADYNMQLDSQCLTGSGTAGQLLGALNVAGINAVTYTDATPTLAELYAPLMQALSLSAKGRKAMPSALFLTPSRWFWMAAQLDAQQRPLILPETNAPFNPIALQTGGDVEGPVGRLLNFPIIADGNIPANLGAGTNEERIITARTSDLYLWEGSMRTRVLTEVLSGTLQVRFQVFNYAAFMPNRRPETISVVSGTGVAAPAGY